MKKTVVGLLDFIVGFGVVLLVGVGLVILFPFYTLRKYLVKDGYPKLTMVKNPEEGEESFSPSTSKPM